MRKSWGFLLAGLLAAGALAGCDGPSDDPAGCHDVDDPCQDVDVLRCNDANDGLDVCQRDDDGCLRWVAEETCGEHQHCVPEGESPECVCQNECTQAGLSYCSGNEIIVCLEDAQGCLFEDGEQNCAFLGQECEMVDGEAQCTGCAENRCPLRGQRRCAPGDVVEVCERQDDGCLDWEEERDCSDLDPPRECQEDGGNAECVLGCRDECDSSGDSRCNEGGEVETCERQDDGCLDWVVTDACDGEFEYCDEDGGGADCETCDNECEAADLAQCNEDVVEICTADENGCLAWVEETDCAALEPAQECYTIDGAPICLASPPGDSCLGPLVIDELPFTASGESFVDDYTDAVDLTGGDGCTARSGSVEAVYAVDLTAGQTLLVRELGGLDAVLSLQPGSCGGGEACLFSSDGGEVEGHRYTAEDDGRVFVIVEAYAEEPMTGDYEIHLDLVLDEVCDDDIDNDFDGDTDCDDPDCFGEPPCDAAETNCSDEGDNDGDGDVDCEDSDCAENPACLPARGIFEMFEGGAEDPIDLMGFSLTFTPAPAEVDGFTWSVEGGLEAFPVAPGSGTDSETLFLEDDDFVEYTFVNLPGFELYGVTYTGIFVSSNGYITFDEGETSTSTSVASFFEQPVVAGLRTDLNPEAASSAGDAVVTVDDWADQVVITFQNTPEYAFSGTPDPNDFQIVLDSDGGVELHYLSIALEDDAIVGVGGGPGVGTYPDETDFIPGEICDDDIDNDLDDLVDCADPDCEGDDACLEICDDDIDNDLDDLVDCEDPDCEDAEACQEVCDDGVDNDLDDLIDCDDPDCLLDPACFESICDDDIDNDDDGLTDCEDDDCEDDEACLEVCDDDIDNDLDDLVDCDDPDCARFPDCVVPVINEVGYDDDGTDDHEVVEIYTVLGDFDLTGYTLVHRNGSNGRVIWVLDLAELSTDEEGYFVIGSTAIEGADLNWEDMGEGDTNAIQNGPDSIVLYEEWDGELEDGVIVDAVAYEDFDADEHPFGEGDVALGIGHDNWSNSIGRYPDGADTDDNYTDFPGSWWITPGGPNTPAQPEGYARLTGSTVPDEGTVELPLDIPDDDEDGVDLGMIVPAWVGMEIANVHVGVRIRHTYRGDLILTLTSPGGTTVVLQSRSGGDAEDLETVYDLATEPPDDSMDDFNGENPVGTWTLNVSDRSSLDTGEVLEWVLWIDAAPLPVD